MRTKSTVAVVVVGDVGRSPRMQNHALALASSMETVNVKLVGCEGCPPMSQISLNPKIDILYLKVYDRFSTLKPRLLVWIMKFFFNLVLLFRLLLGIPNLTHVLCQLPPGVPLLFLAKIVCLIRGAKLIVDWHNYGYTRMKLDSRSPITVELCKFCERVLALGANEHFCVTNAMKEDLKRWIGINATVLPDHPLFFRKKFDTIERESFVGYLLQKLEMTEIPASVEKPLILVSPTSWTTDEDFDILLNAAILCDKSICNWKDGGGYFPPVKFIITGKGELRNFYLQKIKKLILSNIRILTAYLSFEDYYNLLCSADMGISMHISSSKLDLPYKIVDMFSCQLPVVTMNYECIGELVKESYNGFVVNNSSELAAVIFENFKGGIDSPALEKMRENLSGFSTTWEDVWRKRALRVFL